MNIKLYTALILSSFLGAGVSFGQSGSLLSAEVDAGTSFAKGAWAPSVGYHEEMGMRALPWLRGGLGIRAWGFYSDARSLHTDEAVQSHLQYRNISLNGISVVAGLKLHFKRVDLGANTDIIGAVFGTNRHAFNNTAAVSTRPSNFSLLPGLLPNYSGQSELFVRLRFVDNFGLKLGYTFTQLSYVTRNVDGERVFIGNKQRRVHRVEEMPYVALTFSL